MGDLCLRCRTNVVGEERRIKALCEGREIFVFKLAQECEACSRKQWERYYEDCKKGKFVSFNEKGESLIDWKAYFSFVAVSYQNDFTVYHIYPELQKRANWVLVFLGLLSFSAKENWEIIGGEGADLKCLNPKLLTFHLYFTEKKNAVDYSRMAFGAVEFDWEIRQISQVFTKKEIIGG